VPIDFTDWKPADIRIGTEDQLDKLHVPSDEKIESIVLKPKKYKNNYIGYKVKIHADKTLTDWDEEVNPSPPATREENTWPN
jgi:hypothetical protein